MSFRLQLSTTLVLISALAISCYAYNCPNNTIKAFIDTENNGTLVVCMDTSSLHTPTSNDIVPKYVNDFDVTALWLIITGAIVFLMQAGFSMLEAGSVSSKNSINILYKNVLDACIGAIAFWLFGYAFAYGGIDKESFGGFIGTADFALSEEKRGDDGWHYWFFQFAFAATAATIVSGSVAERTKLEAYFIYAVFINAFTYPVVVHWVWGGGWLGPTKDNKPIFSKDNNSNGFIDFAGSGVVHMVGGFSGLVGAWVVGPRKGRFEVLSNGKFGKPLPMPGHSGFVLTWRNDTLVRLVWFQLRKYPRSVRLHENRRQSRRYNDHCCSRRVPCFHLSYSISNKEI